jgi:hypothetical protein
MIVETAWNYIEFISTSKEDNELLEKLYNKIRYKCEIEYDDRKEFFKLSIMTYC